MTPEAPNTQTVLWDATGRPYWATASGGKSYIPPIVAAQYTNDPRLLAWAHSQGATVEGGQYKTGAEGQGGGLFHGSPTWNSQAGKYDVGLDWGKILSMVAAGIMTAGVADVVMGAPAGTAASLSGGGAGTGTAAAGTGAATGLGGVEAGAVAGLTPGVSLPGAGTALGTALGGVESGAVAGLTPGVTLPGAGTSLGGGLPSLATLSPLGGLAPGATHLLPAGASALKGLLGPIIAAAVGTAGRTLTNGPGGGGTPGGFPPELLQLLQESVRRQQQQGPLFDAVTRQALGGLPTYAKTPGGQ